MSSAPVLEGRASKSSMEASSQMAGSACDAGASGLAGVSCICVRPDQRETQVQASVQPCSRGWGMRGARTRDGLLAQVPLSIVMSRWSGIALSDSRADLPRTTMLMPAHLRGAKQGDGLTGRQWRREWAKDGAKPDSPADRSTNVCNENSILLLGHRQAGGAQCAHRLTTEWRRASLTAAYS